MRIVDLVPNSGEHKKRLGNCALQITREAKGDKCIKIETLLFL